jgi:small subunit ribosomal protein S1
MGVFMAKVEKRGGDRESKSAPAPKKPLPVKGIDLDVDVKSVELEKDELAEFKAAKKAEEEEGINQLIHDATARKSATTSSVSLENFNWDAFDTKGFGEGYSTQEREDLLKQYSGTVTTVSESEVVKGIVVGINDRDVILNIGFKSDGLVPLAEFKDQPNLKIGDEVDLFIEERENAMGQLILSRRKAKLVKGWEYVQTALDKDQVIEGFVKRRTKGGLIVDVFGIEAFLPGSQIDVKPIRDFDIYVNKSIEVKVVKINYTNDNVVVSHKVLIEKDLEQQKAVILTNLEKGQVLEGVIKNMTNFGVFIDLGGVDGLLHITDISWGRINHPDELLKLDQVVKVVVLDFDEDKRRISLGMKQLTPHPWESLPKEIIIGSKVKGKIVNVADYGAFLELQPGVEGLIHVSEMSWSQHLRNPQDFLKVGDELEAVVLTIDRDERKMSLGIKQLSEDPWTRQDVLSKYAVGTRHKGIVRNLTNFGLFIELEEGIDGLVHVSDLSWTKKVKHPSEFTKVGDNLEVVVLELDATNRRLALSHKHIEENPWDTFEKIFTIGSVQKCTIINKNDKGAILELPYGLEGFCAARNLVKEDGSRGEVGESLDFKVLEFSKEDRRIVLSHRAMYSTEEERPVVSAPTQSGAASAAGKKKPVVAPAKGKTIDKINQEAEKSTLGDIEALSALKEKMNASKTPPPAE